jgi:hypothetical protein
MLTEKGEPCRATPQRDSDFCWWHDPAHADEAAEARRLGGLRRRRENTLAAAYDLEGLESIPAIRRVLEIALADALGIDNAAARVRLLLGIAQVGVMLLEKGEHEERLEEIERVLGPKIKQKKPDQKRGWTR